MGRRSEHSREELRSLALTAARRIVEREGMHALTTRRVAGEIGYTVGTLYLVFRNLDDLVLHLNAQTLDELGAAMRSAAGTGRTPEAVVKALGRAYLRFAQRHHRRWVLVFEHRLGRDASLPSFYRARVETLLAMVEEALTPLVPSSKVRRARAARALWGGVHGVCVLGLNGKLDVVGAGSVGRLADCLMENFLKGLSASMQ